jgi:hypothetical protein
VDDAGYPVIIDQTYYNAHIAHLLPTMLSDMWTRFLYQANDFIYFNSPYTDHLVASKVVKLERHEDYYEMVRPLQKLVVPPYDPTQRIPRKTVKPFRTIRNVTNIISASAKAYLDL